MSEKESKKKEKELKRFEDPKNYVNRELSWLEFDYRVLNEARDESVPLFERLKFLSISASNLDEFFMVRVATLKDLVREDHKVEDIAGLRPQQQLDLIGEKAHELVEDQYSIYSQSILPALKRQGLRVVSSFDELSEEESSYVDRYFEEFVYPVLTPMAVDSARPFPLVRNKSLNIAVLLRRKKENRKQGDLQYLDDSDLEYATVQVPSVLPRIVELPASEDGTRNVILLEEIIEKNMQQLFLNFDIVTSHPYRVMRDADLSLEEEAEDLLTEIEKQLKSRQWGEVIRLDVEDRTDKRLLKFLKRELNVGDDAIYEIAGPLDLTFLTKMYDLEGFDYLKEDKYIPQPVPALMNDDDIFACIRKGDILLHHPYQTFDPVVEFVRQAAKDPDVLAIKQTLYRVSGNSPIVAALAEAADNGKQVTVLLELKARFDEENNINWAKSLEKAGVHVIYGLVGLKTHCKITLIVRREEDGLRRYVHLGTGNYNDTTARQYTDCGLLTCAPRFGEDATAVFNMLSGYSEPPAWNELVLAPLWLRSRVLRLIRRETQHAKEGRPAHIMAKMNSLSDKEVIASLYEASCAGVRIELIVRGICCLKAGVPGLSENISVHSIVGTFLEHARILYVENDGTPLVFLGSADWMPRNLDHRVEIMFPIEDGSLKEELIHILRVELDDDVKAYILQPDGSYVRMNGKDGDHLCAQETFCREAVAAADAVKRHGDQNERLFKPVHQEDH